MQEKQVFEDAQRWEGNWWVNHITKEIKPENRDVWLGYCQKSLREHMSHFGVIKGNRLWSHEGTPIKMGEVVLDVGCNMVSFHEGRNYHVVAIDPILDALSKAIPEIAMEGKSRNVTYISSTLEKLYTAWDGFFDHIWCCNMLDHTPDWLLHLTTYFPFVLKPKGKLWLLVDVRRGEVMTNVGHMGVFTDEELMKHVSKNFEIIKTSPLRDLDYYRLNILAEKKP